MSICAIRFTLPYPGYWLPGLLTPATPIFVNGFQLRTATEVLIITARTALCSASFCFCGSSGTM